MSLLLTLMYYSKKITQFSGITAVISTLLILFSLHGVSVENSRDELYKALQILTTLPTEPTVRVYTDENTYTYLGFYNGKSYVQQYIQEQLFAQSANVMQGLQVIPSRLMLLELVDAREEINRITLATGNQHPSENYILSLEINYISKEVHIVLENRNEDHSTENLLMTLETTPGGIVPTLVQYTITNNQDERKIYMIATHPDPIFNGTPLISVLSPVTAEEIMFEEGIEVVVRRGRIDAPNALVVVPKYPLQTNESIKAFLQSLSPSTDNPLQNFEGFQNFEYVLGIANSIMDRNSMNPVDFATGIPELESRFADHTDFSILEELAPW